jgi:multidrug efflux pump
VEKLAQQELPSRLAYEWTELTFLEKQSRHTGLMVFALSVVFVFLVLAALYESWWFPLVVMLVVPVGVASSLWGVWLTDPASAAATVQQWQATSEWFRPGDWFLSLARTLDDQCIAPLHRVVTALGIRKQDVNIFTQVGFVVLVGLACKNAILLVEYARAARQRGQSRRQAVLEACQLRYRPILMTSAAFMFGVLPLAAAQGAGAEIRQAIGVAVLGGMLGVTFFGILFTPVWFVVVDWLTSGEGRLHRALHRLSKLLWWFSGVGLVRWLIQQGYRRMIQQYPRWRQRLAGVRAFSRQRSTGSSSPTIPGSSP